MNVLIRFRCECCEFCQAWSPQFQSYCGRPPFHACLAQPNTETIAKIEEIIKIYKKFTTAEIILTL